jgi:polyribonucleotide nucleotidyltransferase
MAEVSVTGPISGTDKTLTLSTGVLAPQSQGAVVARIGDTQVLSTANGAKEVREGTDFFPLTIDVEEKAYAAGKIPGSFFRREGRPSDAAVLVCRLIDRPLRPSFPEGLPQRDPGRHHRPRRRPRQPLRHHQHQRRLGVADADRASRSRAPSVPCASPTAKTAVDPAPHLRRDRGVHVPDRGGRSRGRRPDRHHDGRGLRHREGVELLRDGAPKVTEAVIAGGLEACKTWIAESIALQNELVAKVGRKPAIAWENQIDFSDEIEAAVAAIAEASWPRPTRSPTRPSATPPTTPSRPRSSPRCAVRAPRSRARPAR